MASLARLLLVLPFILVFTASLAWGATSTVNLAWDANTEADLAGYKLYQSATVGGTYSVVQAAIPRTSTTTSVSGLADGMYFFKLTAFDTAGNESGFSNTVSFRGDTTPPGTPTNLRVTSAVVTP